MRVHAFLPRLAIVLAIALLGAACRKDGRLDETETLPVDQLYAEAKALLEAGNYERSVRYYRRLVARFPFGKYTEQAELDTAYAQYKAGEPEEALSTINRFIRQYPTNKHVDYAYYLRGLINFNREVGLLERYVANDNTRRDLGFARQSFQDFGELLKRFPDSRYAEDARQRLVYLANALSMFEVHVARYYYNRTAYVAAASRAQASLVNYPRTPANEHALDVLIRSYDALDLAKLRDDTREIMVKTYPNSLYLTGELGASRPWWKFWGNDIYRGVDTGRSDGRGGPKPWWQIW